MSEEKKAVKLADQTVSWAVIQTKDKISLVPMLNTFYDTGIVRSIMGPNGRPAGAAVKADPVVLDSLIVTLTMDEVRARMDMGIQKQLMALGVLPMGGPDALLEPSENPAS